jgi:myo-inositol-1(or 4)-monophosphatase
VAVRAAAAAGRLLRERATRVGPIRHKGVVDIVTEVDLASEALVRDVILGEFPSHTIVGEEGGAVVGADPGCRWHVDPLDGTTNYAHGFPFYCVSIGLEVDGELELGAVYDPSLGELFVGGRGHGATLNGRPMRVSSVSSLREGLLATGFPYDHRHFARALRSFEALSRKSQAVRRAGSAALDLCYVACGRLEGYWEHRVSSWDVAAGALLVVEAGGTVTRPDGAPFAVDCGDILASNRLLHPDLVVALAEAQS